MKFRKIRKRFLSCITNNSGFELSLDHAMWAVIIFAIGGIILGALTDGFQNDILPSLIQTFKNIVTW